MIISRCPLRVSFTGGGSDLPFYFKKKGGEVISASINKYVNVIVNPSFDGNYRISYSKTEICSTLEDIEHPIVRETLRYLNISDRLEIVSVADIPSKGSGLGSSSAFTCALISALSKYKRQEMTPMQIASAAAKIEIELCNSPIGYQDQYGCAIPSLKRISFPKNGNVQVISDLGLNKTKIEKLSKYCRLYYTGITRSANQLLGEIAKPNKQNNSIKNIDEAKKQNDIFINALIEDDYALIGKLMNSNFLLKCKLNQTEKDDPISRIHKQLCELGAYGAKLLGAGGGGFFLCVADKKIHQKLKAKFHAKPNFDLEVNSKGIQSWII